jgi:hypothetical protein
MKKADLLEWSKLEAERRTLQRAAATIRARQNELEATFEDALKSSGKTQIRKHGFTLAYQPGRATVRWADEFLKACGPEAVQTLKDAAAAISKTVFVLTPPESLTPDENDSE